MSISGYSHSKQLIKNIICNHTAHENSTKHTGIRQYLINFDKKISIDPADHWISNFKIRDFSAKGKSRRIQRKLLYILVYMLEIDFISNFASLPRWALYIDESIQWKIDPALIFYQLRKKSQFSSHEYQLPSLNLQFQRAI